MIEVSARVSLAFDKFAKWTTAKCRQKTGAVSKTCGAADTCRQSTDTLPPRLTTYSPPTIKEANMSPGIWQPKTLLNEFSFAALRRRLPCNGGPSANPLAFSSAWLIQCVTRTCASKWTKPSRYWANWIPPNSNSAGLWPQPALPPSRPHWRRV